VQDFTGTQLEQRTLPEFNFEQIIPAQNGIDRNLFDRMQPNNDELNALWDRNNPFAPIAIGEPFVPDAEWFEGRVLLFRP
jgi:hypothetical protein